MKPHRTDKVSFGFGLFFLLLVVWWLLDNTIDIPLPTAGWFIAGGLILFGVLGLVGSLRPRGQPDPIGPAASPDQLDATPDQW